MRNIKNTIARYLYHLLVFIVKLLPARQGRNHLLIIKLDEIGDFMLFRNYLKYFRQSPRYKDHRITLLGNAAWRPIFETYDKDTVDDTIWVVKKDLNRNLAYRFGLLRQVRQLGTSDVINCVFSRFFALEDGFAYVACGNNKVAMAPEENNTNRGKNGLTMDRYTYTSIHSVGDEKIFDTIRNKRYLDEVLQLQLPFSIRLQAHHNLERPQEPYFALFVGAGNMIERKWGVDKLLQCAEHIFRNTQLFCVVCGGPQDVADAAEFMRRYPGRAVNYSGKTTLPHFIELMSGARLLLSVDTGPVHMAAASGCPVVGLYSGVHYGRYAPYPKELADPFYSIYADHVEQLIAAKSPDLYDPFIMKNEFIKLIPAEKVIPYLDKILNIQTMNA